MSEQRNGQGAAGEQDTAPYLGDIPTHDPAAAAVPGDAGGLGAAVAVVAAEVGETRAEVRELRDQQSDVLETLRAQGQQLQGLGVLAGQVAALSDAVAELGESSGEALPWRPMDAAHLADLDDAEQAEVLADLVAWVRTVLLTGWPWAADQLAPCWLLHPDILTGVLWLRAAYIAAYDDPRARPHAAADFHRWLADVLRDAAARTEQCPADLAVHPVRRRTRDDSGALVHLRRRAALEEVYTLTQVQASAGYAEDAIAEAREASRRLVSRWGINQQEYDQYVALREQAEQ